MSVCVVGFLMPIDLWAESIARSAIAQAIFKQIDTLSAKATEILKTFRS
ncbi:hypothetical protein QUB70_17425 [Microcoleus sp. A003_D6]